MMPSAMIDLMVSLSAIMHEETALLQTRQRSPALPELASAKVRLVAQLEESLARRNRLEPNWVETLDTEERSELDSCLDTLRIASSENAAILERHIELSQEMLSAIANEARRLAGNRTFTYGAAGDIARSELPTPISFNTQL